MKTSATLTTAVSLGPSAGRSPQPSRRLARGLLAATLGTVLSVFPGGSARAENFERPGFYEIVNAQSGKCLDVNEGSIQPNQAPVVQQYHCNGSDNQHWAIIEALGGYVVLINKRTGDCVDFLTGQRSGEPSFALTCTTFELSQQWYPAFTGIPNVFSLVNPYGFCLDVTGGSQADNARVQTWYCNGTGAQQWRPQ